MKDLNRYIDHTILAANATEEQLSALCEEAVKYEFFSVCVNPIFVPQAKSLLGSSSVQVCTVIDFPLGASTAAAKAEMTKQSIADGATEVDMVIPIGLMKAGNHLEVLEHMRAVVKAADGTLVKVIVETCLLTDEEKIKVCQLVSESGAQFIKTSTGFSTGGATKEDIELFRDNVASHVKIKASGGIRSLQDALQMIESGAHRLGTSRSVALMEEALNG